MLVKISGDDVKLIVARDDRIIQLAGQRGALLRKWNAAGKSGIRVSRRHRRTPGEIEVSSYRSRQTASGPEVARGRARREISGGDRRICRSQRKQSVAQE